MQSRKERKVTPTITNIDLASELRSDRLQSCRQWNSTTVGKETFRSDSMNEQKVLDFTDSSQLLTISISHFYRNDFIKEQQLNPECFLELYLPFPATFNY